MVKAGDQIQVVGNKKEYGTLWSLGVMLGVHGVPSFTGEVKEVVQREEFTHVIYFDTGASRDLMINEKDLVVSN